MSTVNKISNLQKNIKNIRNICILAHVDHGKTTLSDSLLASNGIISERLAGKVRYLDSREDEQERGITMESSGISLSFQVITNIINNETKRVELQKEDYLINLIDSPGHIDFSSEVSIASRLCDGALVLVDVVEGICTQTHTVLRQAWDENIRCIIVFNKIDRLITELRLTATEAYVHIRNLLEQINAIIGSFYVGGVMEEDNLKRENKKGKDDNDGENENEWDEEKEKEIFFSPEKGNVIFASAIDGWAFRIDSFAKIYAKKLGMKEANLMKCLWGDYYLDPKTKMVIGYKHLKGRNLKPMFVQFILDNIWTIFEAVENNDKEKIDKIVKSLNLKILPRDLKSKDRRAVQSTICSNWLPLAQTVLYSIIEQIPSPLEAQKVRLPKLLYPQNLDNASDPDLTNNQKKLEKALYSCDSSDEAPVVIIVSKMVDVKAEDLPTNRRVQLTAEEMRENRRKLLAQRKLELEGQIEAISLSDTQAINSSESIENKPDEEKKDSVLIGFARIFSGTIHEGQTVYVMGPKYDPTDPTKFCTQVTVKNLYLIMGRELETLKSVPAGNVFGIGGLEEAVLKSATISTLIECPSLINVDMKAPPIVRVAVEPYDPGDMPKLVEGLKLLNQADSCVEVLIQETGEHVIVTAGELHLERCLKDLREKYAKIGIHASDPIVPYRETLSNQPAINTNPFQEYSDNEDEDDIENNENEQTVKIKDKKINLPIGTKIVNTSKDMCTIRIRAVPLPEKVTKFLVDQSETIKRIVDHYDNRRKNSNHAPEDGILEEQKEMKDKSERQKFLNELQKLFDESYDDADKIIDGNKQFWKDIVSKIWSFGSKRIGPNILINNIPGYERTPWCDINEKSDKENTDKLSVKDFEGSINSGFQIATNSGPLCAEPMMGVCFILENFNINFDQENIDALSLSTLSGQVISTIKESCCRTFLEWSPRLSLATYSCEIQAAPEVLGKIYGVLSKRHARIYEEDLKEGTQFFQIKSLLPVIESFGFADEIRKRTSGAASPQLLFHGYIVLDQDPFWVPTTEEELEDLGEKADKENIAKKYMDSVRKRKGLFVDKKIVEHGEKQRTLKSK
jgi:ribosome assembly protein 1